jgi:hypothetical protein
MSDKPRVLVVANRTAESPDLLAALKERGQGGAAQFTLLVPATPHGLDWAADMSAGEDEARTHLDPLLGRLRDAGLEVSEAKLGDPDALAAVQDEMNFSDYDEVIVSTLPLHLSKWLHLDLPSKVRAATGLPVTHIISREKVPT